WNAPSFSYSPSAFASASSYSNSRSGHLPPRSPGCYHMISNHEVLFFLLAAPVSLSFARAVSLFQLRRKFRSRTKFFASPGSPNTGHDHAEVRMPVLTLTEKLDQLDSRYEEMTQQLSSAEVVSDSSRFQKLAKQHAELSEIVTKH